MERTPAGHYSISLRHAPTADEANWLKDRKAELVDGLRPSEPREIADLVSAMMLGFGGASRTEADAKKTVALYVSQLAAYPAWAVKTACEEAMRSGSEFAPSVAKLVASARQAVSRWQIESARITQILDAPVYREPDPGERQRVIDEFDRIMSELHLNQSIENQSRRLDEQVIGSSDDQVTTFSDSLVENLKADQLRKMG